MTYIATFYSHFGAIRYKRLWPQEVEQVVQALPEGYRTCYRAENS